MKKVKSESSFQWFTLTILLVSILAGIFLLLVAIFEGKSPAYSLAFRIISAVMVFVFVIIIFVCCYRLFLGKTLVGHRSLKNGEYLGKKKGYAPTEEEVKTKKSNLSKSRESPEKQKEESDDISEIQEAFEE